MVDPASPEAASNGTASGSATDTVAENGGENGASPSKKPTRRMSPDGNDYHAPQNGYAAFREMLKHPSAQPVIVQIHEFAKKFPSGLPRAEAARRVHKFLSQMQDSISECVVFAAECDEEGRSNSCEGLEKFLISRIHPKLVGTEPGDAAEDERLMRRIGSLRWVDFQHLGVTPVDPSLFALAIDQLRAMETYKAPRDKLVCILNACRVINDVLKRSWAMSDGGDHTQVRCLSADDFLPLLIYAVLKANPPRLHTNIEFVAAFRHPSRLVAEDAYFLTALSSAVEFVKEAGPKVLDVSEEEYDKLVTASAEAFEQELAAAAAAAEAAAKERAEAEAAAAEAEKREAEANASADLEELRRQQLAKQFELLPLHFQDVKSSKFLRVRELPGLLAEYKAMVSLLRELENGKVSNTPCDP
eukprot:gnl/TRDRNA2_/TRDRNA2_189395_c0_seq1.p1 gnl/TRDRNA2_/TRDRNA2_189395_c0~~gnl/TRDRNA2_/TRDRNA2_189395_c0_seq1.p1  ORF type:complete len:465 (-),score=121.03 gnl/TRDRNA2_/TRDRNA2_189395_c0_seq1:81-1328(-)